MHWRRGFQAKTLSFSLAALIFIGSPQAPLNSAQGQNYFRHKPRLGTTAASRARSRAAKVLEPGFLNGTLRVVQNLLKSLPPDAPQAGAALERVQTAVVHAMEAGRVEDRPNGGGDLKLKAAQELIAAVSALRKETRGAPALGRLEDAAVRLNQLVAESGFPARQYLEIGEIYEQADQSPSGPSIRVSRAAVDQLEKSVAQYGFPRPRAVYVKRPVSPLIPTAAILSYHSIYKLSILQEGGRQSEGNVLMAMDPSWLVQYDKPGGGKTLALKKGLYFTKEGELVLAEYKHPRPIHYFANFFTLGAYGRDDGVPLEKSLDIPTSSSESLEKVINDKLFTRIVMAREGIPVPKTLAFMFGLPEDKAKADIYREAAPGIKTMLVNPANFDRGRILAAVRGFLARYRGDEVVVKPSGSQWHSGVGVSILKREDAGAIAQAVEKLVPRLKPGEQILIDGRLMPPPFHEDGQLKDSNVRVLMGWNDQTDDAGKAVYFARVGRWGGAVNVESGSAVTSFEKLVAGWNLSEKQIMRLRAQLERYTARFLKAFRSVELKLARPSREARDARTDYVGLDFMIDAKAGRLTPTIIEANDHDSGGQYQLDDYYPDLAGRHSKDWVTTMLHRGAREILRGKTILFAGAGSLSKKPYMERAKELGLKVVVLDSPGSWAEKIADVFIPIDILKREKAYPDAIRKVMRVMRSHPVDGVVTFWEDDVPLAGKLAETFGWRGASYQTYMNARAKFKTREVMSQAGLPTPRFRTARSENELVQALEHVGYPAIIKPAWGAEALLVSKVRDLGEALSAYRKTQESREIDPILNYGKEVVVEQYLDGQEVDVDVKVQGGQTLFWSVTDNHPTQEPRFAATGSNLTSRLPLLRQKILAGLAARTLRALGFMDGVFHVEAKYTSIGPRIIEVNARMGGGYVWDWVKEVWGVDLVEEALKIAVGVSTQPHYDKSPKTNLYGRFVFPDGKGPVDLNRLKPIEKDKPAGLAFIKYFKKDGDWINDPSLSDSRIALVTAEGATPQLARQNFNKLKL
ncbi:MAG: hypothetical protein A3G41_06570 [Elusimicrobia bacterium RIFCSPLOWO2_12_FULL_59_9]|nr:MAG: hypothetical protein A3G41_06570 [Elusimicrobia bacterium RIFCSPLOWO2_12_FULL_59_9]